jgi:hypothetical protein
MEGMYAPSGERGATRFGEKDCPVMDTITKTVAASREAGKEIPMKLRMGDLGADDVFRVFQIIHFYSMHNRDVWDRLQAAPPDADLDAMCADPALREAIGVIARVLWRA